MNKKHSFLYRNSLSIVMLTFMLVFWVAQFFTGIKVENEEREENGLPALSHTEYLTSGHFIQTTFENWESEFLQMGFYVFLTVYLRQKGSAESKSLDKKEPLTGNPDRGPRRPGRSERAGSG